MAIQTAGNLHWRPLSSRALSQWACLSTSLEQRAAPSRPYRHFSAALSAVTLLTGSAVTIPIALIEAVASAALGLTGLLIALATKSSSERLHKYTFHCLSYSLHSFWVGLACTFVILTAPTTPLHFSHTLAFHALHLFSALYVQRSLDPLLNPSAERLLLVTRLANLLSEDFPLLLRDLRHVAERDLEGRFFERHPEYRPLFEQIDVASLIREEARWIEMLSLFAREEFRLSIHTRAEGDVVILPRLEENELAYQQHLCHLVKAAVSQIYADPSLVCLLSEPNDVQEGREALAGFDAEITFPLSRYAQYQELLEEALQCPPHFQSKILESYQGRQEQLHAARALLQTFTQEEREALVKKLLKSTLKFSERIEQLFLQIHTLSKSHLYTGPLMTEAGVNIRTLEDVSHNLFTKAWREAVQEIDDPV